MSNPIVAIVLPCYNEEEVLPISFPILLDLLYKLIENNTISSKSFLCFVDDGSKDNSWEIISGIIEKHEKQVIGVRFSRNFGHQSAILAGMLECKDLADCVITIDIDLQDDIDIIEKMVLDYSNGCEIVYGVRDERKTDTFFKRWTALSYYRLLKFLGVDLIYNHADFRLIGSKALTALSKFNESNLFLRGLFPVLGFKSSKQYYNRKSREAGETKYTLNKMLSLAWNGISSFSNKPLKLSMYIGWITLLISICLVFWAFYQTLIGESLPGWASTVIPIYFIGGIQLLFLGVIGEYIGKIYLETKNRPQYIIDEKISKIH